MKSKVIVYKKYVIIIIEKTKKKFEFKQMSSSITIMQSLSGLANSSNYCPPIALNSKIEVYHDYKFQYQPYVANIEVVPPSIWLGIEENKCLTSIRNDVQRSRISREGLLSTNQKGNLLNKITYTYDEDIGTIQQTQQCFCIGFSVVKDNCEDFLKQIASQIRSCLVRKSTLIDRSHLKVGQLDELTKQIYNKYRVFLIFDTKSQPGRIISIHSCFYPNVRFTLQRIVKKDKQAIKFSPNQVLSQLQRGEIVNTFGFLSLDQKHRFLLIKKDDPELSNDNFIGVWVVSSFKVNSSRKQFGKFDAIWLAILDYYTNPEVKKKLSIISNQRGFMCYFGLKKGNGSGSRLDTPQYYLFQPSLKSIPKWSFLTKSQFVTDLTKTYQIKIDALDNTIVEQKQYSQFSDQPNNLQNINGYKSTKNLNVQSNESALSGSSQGKQGLTQSRIYEKEKDNQKQKIIKQLRQELQKYKQRCAELEIMNRILMQQKMVNQLYQNQCSMMSPMIQYGQIPMQYPLSLSQVGSPHHPYAVSHPITQQQSKLDYRSINNSQNQVQLNQRLVTHQLNTKIPSFSQKSHQEENSQDEKESKPIFGFPETKEQQITFGFQDDKLKQKSFGRKIQSYVNQKERKEQIKQNDKQPHIYNKDVRNISFQDSFAEYHSDGEQDGPTFKSPNYLNKNTNFFNKDVQKTLKLGQFQSQKKKKDESQNEEKYENLRSPQFKRTQSLQSEVKKNEEERNYKQAKKQIVIQTWNQQTKPNNTVKEQKNQKQKQNTNKQLKSVTQKNIQEPIEEKIIKKYGKKMEIQSNQSEQEEKSKYPAIKSKMNQKQNIKKQTKKPILNSDSDDSDEDQQLKRIRLDYLKR